MKQKISKPFGNSAHILMPKRTIGQRFYLFLTDKFKLSVEEKPKMLTELFTKKQLEIKRKKIEKWLKKPASNTIHAIKKRSVADFLKRFPNKITEEEYSDFAEQFLTENF